MKKNKILACMLSGLLIVSLHGTLVYASETKASPDKYTFYIKDYNGMNAASVGYTSLGGDRLDRYGSALMEIAFLTNDGSYIDIANDDDLKNYVVIGQNIEPNTELKLSFQKDDNGEEYDNLIDNQSFDEIVLNVKQIAQETPDEIFKPMQINPSPDRYTQYIKEYTNRNAGMVGYLSLSGDIRDKYGNANIKINFVSDDGSFVDVSEEGNLKDYFVTGQNIQPNTELKLIFMKDDNGEEYDNLVENQSFEEITLNVTRNNVSSETETAETQPEETAVQGIRPEFKEAMESYEAFFDEYAEFMKNYNSSDDTASLLSDYTKYMTQYTETMEKLNALDDGQMSEEESTYYAEVMLRISQKLIEAAQ